MAFEHFKHENMKEYIPGGYIPKPEPEDEIDLTKVEEEVDENGTVTDEDDQTATADGNMFPPSTPSKSFLC